MPLSKTFPIGQVLSAADTNTHLVNHVPSDGDAFDTGWIGLPLAGTGYESKSGDPAYRRVGMTVHLRGLIGPVGSGNMPTTANTILFTLNSGFRPAQSEWFAVGTTTGQPPGTVVVLASGGLQWRPPPTPVLYIGLASIVFLVD